MGLPPVTFLHRSDGDDFDFDADDFDAGDFDDDDFDNDNSDADVDADADDMLIIADHPAAMSDVV